MQRERGARAAARDLLMSPDLLRDLSGEGEKGVRTPATRIPAKTNLGGVLLNSNPWEQRNLDRKLARIHAQRNQKERALDWSQRQFFINQIFDHDYNLRFTKTRIQTSSETEKTPQMMQEATKTTPNIGCKYDNPQTPVTESKRVQCSGLGIFAPPVLAKKAQLTQNSCSDGNANNKYIAANHAKEGLKTASSLPTLSKPQKARKHSTYSEPTTRVAYMYNKEKTVPGNLNMNFEDKIQSKALSLPNIYVTQPSAPNEQNLIRQKTFPCPKKVVPVDEKVVHEMCNGNIILRLTKMLPMPLMLKASQNLNEELSHKRRNMVDKCRDVVSQDSLTDPRWKRLTSTLVSSQEA